VVEIKDNAAETLAQYRGFVKSVKRAISTVLFGEASLLSNYMKKGLRDQQPGGRPMMPLSKMTIQLRGFRIKRGPTHTKALIDSGSMIDSICARKRTWYRYTVGVHRNAKSKDGRDLVNIAAVHEYGSRPYTVTVTPKMRRFSIALMMAGILKVPWRVGQELHRQIPARPFLNPAHDEWSKGAEFRFSRDVAKILGVRP